jgi:hypothetical protein
MKLFGLFRKSDREVERQLLGCWQVVRVDGAPQISDAVELDFRSGGHVYSSAKFGPKWEVDRFDWYVDGAYVVFENKNRMGFVLEADGSLRIDAYDHSAWYRRGPKEAPEP